MKSLFYSIIGILFIAITSCTSQNNDNNNGQEDSYNQPNSDYSSQNQGKPDAYNASDNGSGQQNISQNQGGDKIVMHPIMDPKTNQPSSQIPLPASWKIHTNVQANAPGITGPDGIEVYFYAYQGFMYSNDPYMQQAYQASGQQIRPPAGIENVMNQDIAQMASSIGLKFVKQYPLHQVAQADKNYADKLFKAGEQQTTFSAAGSDWEDGKGNKVVVITHYNENAGQGSIYWGYYIQVLGSKGSAFENAKNAYLNGLVNTQYNPQSIAAYNQAEAAKANQSWSTHNQKMQSNQANFDAQQRAHQSSVDAWNKSSMDGYNSRSASQDKMHNQTINSINETQNVTDPNTGQQYQVEGYSNQYWVNGQGEYIPSDNSLYNPNLDTNYNHQNWDEAPVNPH